MNMVYFNQDVYVTSDKINMNKTQRETKISCKRYKALSTKHNHYNQLLAVQSDKNKEQYKIH